MLARIQTHLNLKRAQMALKTLQNELMDRVENRRKELRETNNRLEVEIADRIWAEQVLEKNGKRLQALSHRLVQVQEEERHHIARELHDEIGQVLTTVKLNLQMAQRQFDQKVETHLVEDSIDIVDQAIQQVRDLSVNLRPSILDDLGLVSALKWYVKRQAQRIDAEIRLEVDDLAQRPHADIEIACFRIMQETLTNIVRHAHAKTISIRLSHKERQLSLEIEDNGVEFDVEAALTRASLGGSLGLLGMQERVELVRGHFGIHSKPGKGTRIECRFPLNLKERRLG
jgi:signal transduction histidine kinase